MAEIKEQHTIEGKEKSIFLFDLDNALSVLAKNLSYETDAQHIASLIAFGKKENWDWQRLARPANTYRTFAELVEMARQAYKWFDAVIDTADCSKNRSYFDSISISAESGLPWVYDFIDLQRLQSEADKILSSTPSYSDNVDKLQRLLLEDYVELCDVESEAGKIHASALKRSFLEQLKAAQLLGFEAGGYSLAPQAKKILSLGGEELWSIVCIRYSMSSSLFQAYVLDVWQDIREPQISEDGETAVVSPALASTLRFGDENAAWFMLKTIDDRFKSLHPVHVSRALIGPFENKYRNHPLAKRLDVATKLLAEDENFCLLRFSRQYSYAPNHIGDGDRCRQVIHQDDWRDEMLVCPAKYSSRVSKSVLGTNVRIFEM